MRIIRFIDKDTMETFSSVEFPEMKTGHRIFCDYRDGVCGIQYANKRERL